MLQILPALIAAAFVGTVLVVLLARWMFVVAQPDEWLLRIRNGKLVDAGVGISLWRLPGDVVARFSSTVQRVKFATDALCRQRLGVRLEGFILWSVSPDGDDPFRAFRKLGIANLDAPPPDLKSKKHLLSSAQHKAFMALLDAQVQRHAVTLDLEELLGDRNGFVTGLARGLAPFAGSLGIRIDEIELTGARPIDGSLLTDLAVADEQRVREEATRVRRESQERIKQAELEAETRRAGVESAARSARETRAAQEQLALDEERAKLVDGQARARLAQLESERAVKARADEIAHEQALEALRTRRERDDAELQARQAREEIELAARLDRVRREAEAQRDAILAVAGAEEQKSQAVRDHELGRLVAEKVTQALGALPLKDARWISVGADSPAASLAGLIAGLREAAAPPFHKG